MPNPVKSPRDLLADAIRVVGRNPLGLLTTVDPAGTPHSRWMGSMSMDGLKRIYTLSGAHARKLQHLQTNPAVCWVFSSLDATDVVTIYGQTKVLDDPGLAQAAWERLSPGARTYAMSVVSGEDLELVTLETITHRAEYLSPRQGLFTPVELPLDI